MLKEILFLCMETKESFFFFYCGKKMSLSFCIFDFFFLFRHNKNQNERTCAPFCLRKKIPLPSISIMFYDASNGYYNLSLIFLDSFLLKQLTHHSASGSNTSKMFISIWSLILSDSSTCYIAKKSTLLPYTHTLYFYLFMASHYANWVYKTKC